MDYPDKLEIIPLAKPPNATIRVPGSKSITNRALVLAALQARGFGSCELTGVLQSEDSEVMVSALKALNFEIDTDWSESRLRVSSRDRERVVPASGADLFVGNSGTTMRFLTAMVSLGRGRYRLDGVPRMRERPIEDLLEALRQLGVGAYSERGNGCPPVIVEANGLAGGKVRIKGDVSSQFLSGLLLAAPFAQNEVIIEVEGQLVSAPYVVITLILLESFGFNVSVLSPRLFKIAGQQLAGRQRYEVEPDASAASYFFGAAAIAAGKVCVPTGKVLLGMLRGSEVIEPSRKLLQGDWRFVDVLEQMGCSPDKNARWKIMRGAICERTNEPEPGKPVQWSWSRSLDWLGIEVQGHPLHGIDVDMNDISDTVMTLAAVACFAEGPTTIRNVAHIRHKETDRLTALATELRKVGALVEEYPDGLKITPRPLHGAEIDTYNDHRMAMSMALIGLKVPGIVIKNPGCVAKTYPGFWQDLEKLRQ